MPRGDRMGPAGRGPMTGRGAGFCGRLDEPGFASRFAPRLGLGWRWGRGRGGGWRMAFFGPSTRQDEVDDLKAEAEWLRRRLEAVDKRLEEAE